MRPGRLSVQLGPDANERSHPPAGIRGWVVADLGRGPEGPVSSAVIEKDTQE